MYNLTEGALERITQGIDVEKPVLQILGYKKLPRTVNKEGVAIDRYRLLVSDGQRLNSFTLLTTQLNNLITDNILNEYAICRILNYHLSSMYIGSKERHMMLILDMEVLVSGSEVGYKIGNPTDIDSSTSTSTAANSPFPTNGAAEKGAIYVCASNAKEAVSRFFILLSAKIYMMVTTVCNFVRQIISEL